MCGIFGINFKAGKISDGRRAVLANNLARLNDSRGGDSWGMYAFLGGNEIRIKRGLGDFQNSAWELADHRVLFGHTRFATHGAKTIKNAHPFEFGNIIGAHNGMIYNHADLNKQYKRDFAVDSMHLFCHLSEGLDFSDVEGYGSIEWVDKRKPGSINLVRMSGGELAIYGIGNGNGDETDGIVWSSSDKHLLRALQTAGISPKKCTPYRVDESQVYTVVNGEVFIADKKMALSTKPRGTHYPKWYNSYDGDNDETPGNHFSWRDTATHGKGKDDEKDLKEWQAWNEFVRARGKGGRVSEDNDQVELGGSG